MNILASQVKVLREKTGVGIMECKKALMESEGKIDVAIKWLREHGMARAEKKTGRTATEGVVKISIDETSNYGIILEVNCETDFAAKNQEFQDFAKVSTETALKKRINSVEKLCQTTAQSGDVIASVLKSSIAKIGENIRLRRLSLLSVASGVVAGYTHMGGKIGVLIAIEGKAESLQDLGKNLAMHIAAAAPKYLSRDDINPSELKSEQEIALKKFEKTSKPAQVIKKIIEGQMEKFFKEVCLLEQPFVKDTSKNIKQILIEVGDVQVTAFTRFQLGEGLEKQQTDFAKDVAEQLKN